MTQQIGQYRILSEIGVGGMGVVYRALDVPLEREVALKRLRDEFASTPEVMERFRKEARLQARLNHPNITQLYALLEDGGTACIVMEFVDGTVLSRYMPMAWQSAVPVMLQVLEALDYAHRRGVMHRDIKPENIVIDHEGTVKVMDFGIAHAIGAARLTREKSVIGTLEYMPPERILNQDVDQRSDIYSAGVLLFEMIAGRLPFVCQSEYELLRSHVETNPPTLKDFAADVPEFVAATIRKSMAKAPTSRFASCSEMAASLRDGAAAGSWQLQSVAGSLEIKARSEGSATTEIHRWCERIGSLINAGEFDAAERLADTALNDFPGSPDLARCREQARKSTPRPNTAGFTDKISEDDAALRQILLRIIACEAADDLPGASAALHESLAKYPGRTALKIAEAYLLEKSVKAPEQ